MVKKMQPLKFPLTLLGTIFHLVKTNSGRGKPTMSLSKRTLETLVDLVEIKLSCVEIYDRDDARELQNLEHCRNELVEMTKSIGKPNADIVTMQPKRRRGRPPRAQA